MDRAWKKSQRAVSEKQRGDALLLTIKSCFTFYLPNVSETRDVSPEVAALFMNVGMMT